MKMPYARYTSSLLMATNRRATLSPENLLPGYARNAARNYRSVYWNLLLKGVEDIETMSEERLSP
jgi:hypothetical protein